MDPQPVKSKAVVLIGHADTGRVKNVASALKAVGAKAHGMHAADLCPTLG